MGGVASKRQMKRGEKIKETEATRRRRRRRRRGGGGKAIRGRDCEPRRETYGLFLVSSCVSHSENCAAKAPLVSGEGLQHIVCGTH